LCGRERRQTAAGGRQFRLDRRPTRLTGLNLLGAGRIGIAHGERTVAFARIAELLQNPGVEQIFALLLQVVGRQRRAGGHVEEAIRPDHACGPKQELDVDPLAADARECVTEFAGGLSLE